MNRNSNPFGDRLITSFSQMYNNTLYIRLAKIVLVQFNKNNCHELMAHC